VSAAVLALGAQAREDPQAIQRMAAAERAFAAAAAEQGWRDAALAFVAPDAIVVRRAPAGSPQSTDARTLIRDLPLTKLPVALREIWEPAIGQVSSDGTFGWIIGGRAALALPLQSLANQGAFLHIWKRQDDGSWKVSLIDDVPLPDLWKGAAPFMAMPPPDAGTAGTPDESLADVERAIVNGGDAWRDRLADGVRELSAGHPPIAGRAAVLTWAASGWLGARFSDATADVASSDDLGVAWGRYTLTAPRATIGTWVRVWHRDIGGRWRIVVQMDNDLSVVSR
jgi:ketosteroid isomerase-like protein